MAKIKKKTKEKTTKFINILMAIVLLASIIIPMILVLTTL